MAGSVDMQVLAVLRQAANTDRWLTPVEVGTQTQSPLQANSVTSSIRRLRGLGFVINHVRRTGRTREYSLRKDIAQR